MEQGGSEWSVVVWVVPRRIGGRGQPRPYKG